MAFCFITFQRLFNLMSEDKEINPSYLKGLSGSETAKRKKEIERGAATDSDDPDAYKDSKFKTDFTSSGTRKKTKKSTHTKKFEKMFGEGWEDLEKLLEEDSLDLDSDSDLLREFIEEVLSEKKSGVTKALKNKAEKIIDNYKN